MKKEKSGKAERIVRYSTYLYLAMALLIVSVATASILSLSRGLGTVPEISTPELSFPSVSVSPGTSEPSKDRPGNYIPILPEQPVMGEQSGVTEQPTDNQPLFYTPVESDRVSKGCALESLVFSETMKDYRTHTGIDIACECGTEVRCYADGIVDSIREDEFYGTTVSVRHDRGLITVYANLAPELTAGLKTGEPIMAGTVLGTVGKSALAEAADESHLHFEMLQSGAYIDPENELFG